MTGLRKASLIIRAPEGVEFSLPLAGPGTRLLALALDLAIIVTIGSTLSQLLGLAGIVSRDVSEALTTIAYFAVTSLYGILTEWLWRGQTVGKRVLGLRVVDLHGGRLDPSQVVVRNLLRPVDALPAFYLLGAVVSLCSSRMQRLGDLAAGTVVVRRQDLRAPDLDQLLGSRFNSMLAVRHLAARLRQNTPPNLAAASLEALLRRDQLDPRARLEVFAELARRFRELVTFPPAEVETLSDEQYVRNAVEIVFRPSGTDVKAVSRR
jgi:uncharacterized RDD family membrane protein YckC